MTRRMSGILSAPEQPPRQPSGVCPCPALRATGAIGAGPARRLVAMSSAPPPPSPTTPRPGPGGDGGPGGEEQEPRVLSGPAGTALIALLAVGAAMLLSSGPLWMTLAGLVAAVAGMILAVVALARIRRAPRKATIIMTSVIALVIGLWSLIGGGARLLFWDQVSAYDTCMSSSVTIAGTSSCQQELEDGLREAILPGSAQDAPADGPTS